jgi:hypothetical protein
MHQLGAAQADSRGRSRPDPVLYNRLIPAVASYLCQVVHRHFFLIRDL